MKARPDVGKENVPPEENPFVSDQEAITATDDEDAD